jgi:hypothetical protein
MINWPNVFSAGRFDGANASPTNTPVIRCAGTHQEVWCENSERGGRGSSLVRGHSNNGDRVSVEQCHAAFPTPLHYCPGQHNVGLRGRRNDR